MGATSEELGELYKDAVDGALGSLNNTVLGAMESSITSLNQEIFGDLEIDGMVDSWQELKDVLDSVADSYKMLKEAREEDNTYGELSWQTITDLLTANKDYINLLDIGTDTIKLKSNAEEEMARIQLQALQANI